MSKTREREKENKRKRNERREIEEFKARYEKRRLYPDPEDDRNYVRWK